MEKSLKILMVDKYHFIKGGAERYFFELKEVLESYGHKVIPFSMQHPDNYHTEYEKYFVKNIDFHHNSSLKRLIDSPGIASRIIYSYEAKKKIEELILHEKPDIAHLHMIDHQLSPSILHALKKHNIPVIQTVHQYKMVCGNYKLYNPGKGTVCEKCLNGSHWHPIKEKCHMDSRLSGVLLALEMNIHKMMHIYDNVDLFHVPSVFMKTKLTAGGVDESKIQHLYYTIKLEDYPYSPDYSDYFVYYGRLSKEKGILTLLKTMKEVPEAKLLILGDGPQRQELEEFVRNNNMGNVEFLGNLEKEDLKKVVSKSQFVVVPSEWYDNSPLVIYESFSMGKAIIGAEMGGISELVDHEKNGYLFPAGDVAALRDCITRIYGNHDIIKQFGLNARNKAEAEFEPTHHYQNLLKMYETILNKNSK